MEYLFTFLFVGGCQTIWHKYNMDKRMEELGNHLYQFKYTKRMGKFIHGMSQCEFCMDHHIAVPIIIATYFVIDPHWTMIFWPFTMAQLKQIIPSTNENDSTQQT